MNTYDGSTRSVIIGRAVTDILLTALRRRHHYTLVLYSPSAQKCLPVRPSRGNSERSWNKQDLGPQPPRLVVVQLREADVVANGQAYTGEPHVDHDNIVPGSCPKQQREIEEQKFDVK